MPQSQSISTTRSALTPADKDLAALASAAGKPLKWRVNVFGGLSRERKIACNDSARDGGERWQGLLPWQVKRVRDYVDADLHRRVSMHMAAGHARLSPGYFSRCFRYSFGITFSRFVAERRVERAQELMIGGADKLGQIALACGFADQAHFTRTFGDHLGCTPARWRRHVAMNRLLV